MKNPPAFQFYPKDFLTDYNVMMMTNEQIGCYWKLCCICWIEGNLPSDPASLCKLLGVSEGWFNQNWKMVEVCFKKSTDDEARLIHPRLEIERQKQIEWIKKSSNGGKNSAKQRGYTLKGGSTTLQAETGRVVEVARRRQKTEDRRPKTLEKEESVREEKTFCPSISEAEEIYAEYPKKVGRGDALKSILRAIKILHARPGINSNAAEWLKQHVVAYSESVVSKEKRYIPNPSTWFNQLRFDDPIEKEITYEQRMARAAGESPIPDRQREPDAPGRTLWAKPGNNGKGPEVMGYDPVLRDNGGEDDSE